MTIEVGKPMPYFCPACQAIPAAGFCKLAGCPTAPAADRTDPSLAQDELTDRIGSAVVAWAESEGLSDEQVISLAATLSAEGSPLSDGALGRREHLAPSELTPCFPSPPSQPGGEAERLVRDLAEEDPTMFFAFCRVGSTDELHAGINSILARAEASEQKLAEAEAFIIAHEKLRVSAMATRASLEQRLSAALGEVEKNEEAAEILHDLVQLDGEQWAIGGGPGFKERSDKAWDRARDFVRIEP